MDLLIKQKKLQEEGWKIIKELELENLLSKYGDVDIGGSIKTGLMTWRDIDIGIINNTLPDKKIVWEVASKIENKQHVISITIQDNATDGKYREKYPKGYYIGVKYGYDEKRWKIDIWFAKENQSKTPYGTYDDWLITQLNDENKLKILSIKNVIALNPLYKKRVSSIDIYESVLKNEVNNVDEFKNYIKTTKNIDLA